MFEWSYAAAALTPFMEKDPCTSPCHTIPLAKSESVKKMISWPLSMHATDYGHLIKASTKHRLNVFVPKQADGRSKSLWYFCQHSQHSFCHCASIVFQNPILNYQGKINLNCTSFLVNSNLDFWGFYTKKHLSRFFEI